MMKMNLKLGQKIYVKEECKCSSCEVCRQGYGYFVSFDERYIHLSLHKDSTEIDSVYKVDEVYYTTEPKQLELFK